MAKYRGLKDRERIYAFVSVLFSDWSAGENMKKTVSTVMLFALLISVLSMGACGKMKEEGAKIGVGIHKDFSAKDASGEKSGDVNTVSTVAVTLFDKEGKIIKCYLDTLDSSYEITADGKYKEKSEEEKSKRELGDAYVMSEDKAKLKWYEQADAFAKLAKGKTVDEVKGMVKSDGKGTDALLSAGCTITVSEFALAIEESAKNARDIMVKSDSNIDLKIKHAVKATDAKEGTDGVITISVTAEAFVSGMADKTPAHSAKTDYKASFDKSGKITAA